MLPQTHAVHEYIHTHQVWSASGVFQHLDRYVTGARLKITTVCLWPPHSTGHAKKLSNRLTE